MNQREREDLRRAVEHLSFAAGLTMEQAMEAMTSVMRDVKRSPHWLKLRDSDVHYMRHADETSSTP